MAEQKNVGDDGRGGEVDCSVDMEHDGDPESEENFEQVGDV